MKNSSIPSMASLAAIALFSTNPGMDQFETFLQRGLLDVSEDNALVDIVQHTPAGPFIIKWVRGHTKRYDFLLGSYYSLNFRTYFLDKDIHIKAVGLLNNFIVFESSNI